MLASPPRMHLPDGFLTPAVAIVGWALALLAITVAARQTRRQLGERQIPMMGILAASIFAAQAINFPVAAGTSGHLVGGALAAIVMGPWAATLIMTSVIVVQGLLFQDGGLLAMGWNILNMGVVSAFTGYAIYRLAARLAGEGRGARLGGAFAAAWASVEVGAMATAVELGASATSPLGFALPAMAGVHALIGIGEGLITVGAIAFLMAARPELLDSGTIAPGRSGAVVIAAGAAIALVLAAVSPLASRNPDGLMSVAGQQGFLGRALSPAFRLFPRYTVPFIDNPALATVAAVTVGLVAVLGVSLIVGLAAARRSPRAER